MNSSGRFDGLVGLDLGASSIKVCEVETSDEGHRLKRFRLHPLPVGAIIDGEIKVPDIVVAEITSALSAAGIRRREVAFSVPARSAVLVKAPLSLPLDVDAIWEQLLVRDGERTGLDRSGLRMKVGFHIRDKSSPWLIAVVTPAAALTERYDLLRRAGLRPLRAEIETVALQQAYEQARRRRADVPIVYVHLGRSRTVVHLVDRGVSVAVRVITAGGETISRSLQRRLSLSRHETDAFVQEKIKPKLRPPHDSKEFERILVNTVDEQLSTIARDISHAITWIEAMPGAVSARQALLSGGPATLALAMTLEELIEIPVDVWAAEEELSIDEMTVDGVKLAKAGRHLALALGLTMRSSLAFSFDGLATSR